MAKKEVSPLISFRDLLVKLIRVYKDVYIVNNTFCIGGSETFEVAVGDVVCLLEDKFKDALNKLITEYKEADYKGVIYIKDMTVVKDQLDGEVEFSSFSIEYNIPDSTKEKLIKRYMKIDAVFNRDIVWKCLGEYDELIYALYESKRIYLFPLMEITGENEYVTICKQMIPHGTAKNLSKAYIHLEKFKEFKDLYQVLIDFKFTHFRMMCVYYSVGMPF